MSADEPLFPDVEDVLDIHATQLEVYGGGAGLRDQGLLESAVAQPRASFGGEYVHDDLFAMAAAYLFRIVSNHPFVDGNKRAGLLTALVFLDVNGVSTEQPSEALGAVHCKRSRDDAGKRPSRTRDRRWAKLAKTAMLGIMYAEVFRAAEVPEAVSKPLISAMLFEP